MLDKAASLLKLHEGYRRHPYRCTAGKLTVGYGRNLDDVGVNEIEAEYLLLEDLGRALESIRLEPYWVGLDEVRQAVLLDMLVNLGWTRFRGFERMRAALRDGDYKRAADEMANSQWFHQVGERGERLVRLMRDPAQWASEAP